MKAWRRSEPRTARPFFAVSDLEELLDNTLILIGDRELEIDEDSVQLDPADFESLHVSVLPKVDHKLLSTVLAGQKEHYSFILTLRDPMFKRRVLHRSWPLSADLPDRLSLDQETVEKFGHKRELSVSLALVLTQNIDDCMPGWPSQKGAWIAKRTFKVKLRSVRSTFDFYSISQQEALQYTDCADALLHVEVRGELLAEELEEGVSFATCYIAEGVYDAMQKTTGGQILHGVVMSEVICAVLAASATEIQDVESVTLGTPLATILEQLGQDSPMSLDVLKAVLRDPIKLRAHVHDRTSYVNLLRGL